MAFRKHWILAASLVLLAGATWLALRRSQSAESGLVPQTDTRARETGIDLTTSRPGDLTAQNAGTRPILREEVPGQPTFTLVGRILADPRAPLTGARIVVHAAKPGEREVTYASLMREIGNAPARSPSPRASRTVPDTAQLATAEVAADGSFTIGKLIRRDLRLVLDHTHHALEKACYVHLDGTADRLDLGLLKTRLGAHVLGRVEPRPAPGAHVTLTTEIDSFEMIRSPGSMSALLSGEAKPRARCDEQGGFELRAVPTSPAARVFLQDPNLSAATDAFPLTAGETREIVVHAVPTGSLAVLVVAENGDPIVGAEVEARDTHLTGEIARSQGRKSGLSDASGHCTLSSLAPVMQEVIVSCEGYLSVDKQALPVPGQTVELAVTLTRGLFVSGIVVDAKGTAIEGAQVLAVPSLEIPFVGDAMALGGDALLGRAAETAKLTTNREGRFTLHGLESNATVTIVATKAGWLAGAQNKVRPGTTDVRIVLKLGGKIVGRVATIPKLEVLPSGTIETIVTFALVMQRPTRSGKLTQADGTFELDAVPPGPATLRIQLAGHATFEREIQVEDEQTLDVGTLTITCAARVAGKVVDTDGKGIAGATVNKKKGGMADNPMLSAMLGGESTTTAADGSFVLENLAAGRLTLAASAEGHASGQSARLELAAGQELSGIEIRLGHGGRIRGRLELPAGERAADFQITATKAGAASFATCKADAGGRFELSNLDPARYEVQAIDLVAMNRLTTDAQRSLRPGKSMDIGAMMEGIGERTLRTTCVVRDGQTTEITLDGKDLAGHGTTLSGRVFLGESPLEDGMLEITALSESDSGTRRIAAVRAGAFEARGLAPGSWSLQVRAGITFAPTGEPTQIEIPKGKTRHETTVRLPAGSLKGRVLEEATGAPLGGALVRLLRSNSTSKDFDERGFAMSDPRGEFAFDGLAPGTYALVADDRLLGTSQEGHAGRLEKIVLTPAQRLTGLVLHARASASLAVTITTASGAPAAHAICAVVDRDGHPLGSLGFGVADTNGVAHFAGLASGEARVVARCEGHAPSHSELLALVSGQETKTVLQLALGVHTTLRIEDKAGKRLANATVSLRKAGSPWIPHPLLVVGVDETTGLDLGDLPAGPLELRIEHPSLGTIVEARTIPASARAHLVVTR